MTEPRLPICITGETNDLSPAALAEIASLRGARPLQAASVLFTTWLQIIGAISLAVWADQLWLGLLIVVFIGTRQNKLGLMTHEQCHRCAFPGKHGNLLVNLFASYPLLFISVEDYGQLHLMHHRSYFSSKDPDFLRKSGRDWTFPMPAKRLARLFLRDITGLSALDLVRGKKVEKFDGPSLVSNHTAAWVRPLYLAAIAVVLLLTGTWSVFLLYWLLPLVTVLPAIVRWGALCEHEYNIEGADVKETTPIIIPNRIEGWLLPNLNFGYHTYHHFFPTIAFGNLPRVHEIFAREGLVDEQAIFHSYFAYLKFLVSDQPSPRDLDDSGLAHCR